MGNAYAWWYPQEGGTVEAIDLGGPLSDLDDHPAPTQVGARSVSGHEFSIQTLSDTVVRVSLEDFDDHALYRKLKALEGHLFRGGTFALAADVDKAVAGYLVASPTRGATSLVLGDTPWSTLAPSAVLAANDEVVVETGQPMPRSEIALVSGVSGSTITTGALVHDLIDEPWVLLRHQGFYPGLRLPMAARGRQILSTKRRVVHTFSATFEVPPPFYGAFVDLASADVLGSTTSDGELTIEEILTRDRPTRGGT